MHTTTPHNKRIDFLDATRVFALLLGIVFHASLSFMPVFIGWAVMDISTSSLVSVFVLISHSFRMELFFLLAGFFARLALIKHGAARFVNHRAVRLLIPFIVGWLLLRPMIVSGWIMGAQSMQGDADVKAAVSQSILGMSNWNESFLTGTHLWFLYYLMLFSLVASAMFGVRNTALLLWLSAKLKRLALLCPGCTRTVAVVTLFVVSGQCLWSMTHWGVDTPDKSLVLSVPVTILYGLFFAVGWYFHFKPKHLSEFTAFTFTRLILTIISITVVVFSSEYEMQVGHPDYTVIKTIYTACYAIMMWGLVALTLSVFKRVANHVSASTRYLSDASYWLYLIHLPIVIWLQVAFAELPIHWFIKLASIIAITLVGSIAIYDVLVRNTLIGKVLNGKRKASVMGVMFKKPKAKPLL